MTTAPGPRSWVLPDQPTPVRLINTIRMSGGDVHDDLLTPEDLRDWFGAVGIGHGRDDVRQSDLADARRLRDALRRVAEHLVGEGSDPATILLGEAVERVNRFAPTPVLVLRDGRLEAGTRTSNSSVAAGLARVAGEAIELFIGGDAVRLHHCGAPGCVLYFLKVNPRREWCSVTCGNRVRAARHYSRTRGNPA